MQSRAVGVGARSDFLFGVYDMAESIGIFHEVLMEEERLGVVREVLDDPIPLESLLLLWYASVTGGEPVE